MELKSIYYSIKNGLNSIEGILSSLILITISLIVYRNKGVKYKRSPRGECYILGNGPSLREVLERDTESLKQRDVFVVNGFATGNSFSELRPSNYVIVDPNAFLAPTNDYFIKFQDDIIQAFSTMNWKLCFYAPIQQKNSYFINKIKALNNPNISIVFINTIPVEGPRWFRNKICKTGWAMPRTWNILNAVICLALNQGYRRICLFGADHSWIKDLFVNDNNQLCQANTHFHGGNDYYVMEKGSLESGLLSFSMCLRSYRYLKEYAESIGAIIINKTKGSYLDVFDFEV